MRTSKNLLAKARSVARAETPPDKEVARLAVAWAHGEITYTQAQTALEQAKASVYGTLALGLRDAVKLGMLVKP